MSQVGKIDRTQAAVGNLVHENFADGVQKWIKFSDPIASQFNEIGPKGYTLTGEKLVIAADDTYAGGFMGTDGYLPDSQRHDVVRLETTPARLYIRRAIDNFAQAFAQGEGAFESEMARIQLQAMDAVERGTAFHIHGSSNATVCTFVSRTDADTLVVDAGFGHAGQAPLQFVEPGMVLALLDASSSHATIGVAEVESVTYNTSATTATINFASDIDTGSAGADGDPLVFATTTDSGATHYVTERARAPNGLLDIFDPDSSSSTFMGLAESSSARWAPHVRASSDFGHVEIMEFAEEISAKSTSELTSMSHVITCQNGVKIELAKDLLPYQQQANLGATLKGGWTGVQVGEFTFLTSSYHLWDVMYFVPLEDLAVVDLNGGPNTFSEDGSQFSRLADYDGKEWFIRHYVQRFATRRNRMGSLTGVPNPNKERYSAHPVS